MSNPDVLDLVQIQLKAKGFDGLYHDTGECACLLDDLAPCGQIESHCIAGYKALCTPDCEHEGDSDGPGAWHVQGSKPPGEGS